MATYVSNRDGGSTDEQGHYRFQVKVWDGNIENGMVVTQNSPLGMSVLVGTGDLKIDYSNYAYTAWNDANSSVTITTADGSNPRIDRIVAYIDRGMTPSVSPPNNQGMLKFMAVAGTPNAVPTRPSDATVNSAVGASNPWCDLANVLVGTGVTTIVNSNITDTRQPISLSISADDGGWLPSIYTPDTITANGNKSYDLVFNGTDLTDTITEGMRVRTTRTVAAPIQCTSLNGTTQYYSKTSPNKMTFTDDFVVSAWVKLSSYPTVDSTPVSRFNGTNGWLFTVKSTGQISMSGYNAGGGNWSSVTSYQSIPLHKWVHITAQLDMSAFTTTTTTSYVMIDGVDVPASLARSGTNPTSLVQAGNLEVGSFNGGTSPFPGKIAQVAVYSAKVTQATILASMNQGLTGTETSLASAYSFNNSITDLNTTTPNDLTANGSAVATATDSPFGNSGVSTTLDYGVVMAKSFSTNTTLTVQVPEGCTIPTSGGVATVDYSINDVPYGFVRDKGKWRVQNIYTVRGSQSSPATNTAYNFAGRQMTIPIGKWIAGYDSAIYVFSTGAAVNDGRIDFNTTSATYTTTSPFAQAAVYVNNVTEIGSNISKRSELSLSTATTYYLNYRFASNGTGVNIADLADLSPVKIVADNAYI